MAAIKFRGFEYEIPEEFTNREMIEIERVSQATAGQIYEAMGAGNVSWSMIVAMAAVAMSRAGAKVTLDELLDAKLDEIEMVEAAAVEEPSPDPLPEPEPVPSEPAPAATTATLAAVGDRS